MLLGSVHLKASSKMLVKSIPDHESGLNLVLHSVLTVAVVDFVVIVVVGRLLIESKFTKKTILFALFSTLD